MLLPKDQKMASKVLAAAILLLFFIVYYDMLTLKKTFIHDSLIWFGTFHYYLVNIQKGIFPYWDPYMLTGTYFYPNISGYGLLDPACLVGALVSWLFSMSPLTIFIYFRLYRIAVFVIGAFFFFRHISRSGISSVIAAGVLLFAVMTENIAMPMMDYCFTTPLALYFLMLFIDNIKTSKRYLYLACLTLITGITMNVFIPSAYLFNIVFFFVLLFAMKIRSIRDVAMGFRDRKFLAFAGFCLILVAMMAAPPVSVKLYDASPGGELFPVARMLDRTNNEFKMFMASETSNDLFSETFTEGGGYISWGALMNLLYPDMGGTSFRIETRFVSSATLYFGIIPLTLCVIGLLYARSQYKRLAIIMLLLNFANAFNYAGDGKYHLVQKFFNIIFPPLYMIDTRQNLGSLIFFYICMFLTITLAFLIREENLSILLRSRSVRIVSVCIGIIVAKAFITAFFSHKVLFASDYDFFVILSLAIFAVLAWGYSRGAVSRNALYICLLLMIFSDLGYYCATSTKKLNLDTSTPYNFLKTKEDYRTFSIAESHRARGGFEYFRLPCEQYSPFPSFGETLVETKGALISRISSTIFMTKRYYDLFVMITPEKQFAVNGMYYPIVRFFPGIRAMTADDKLISLKNVENADVRYLESILFLERSDRQVEPFEIKDLASYRNVAWLGTDYLFSLYNENIPLMRDVRQNLESFLSTPDYLIDVELFSINDIVIRVSNYVDGYLYYGDGWSRYWQAFDGERELPVLIANYNSKAVFLEKGKHLVRFVFNPKHYKIALILYYAGLLISVILVAYLLKVTGWKSLKKT